MTLDIERLANVAIEQNKKPVLRLKTLQRQQGIGTGMNRDDYYKMLNDRLREDAINRMAIRSGAIPSHPVLRLKSSISNETKVKALQNIISKIS